MDVKIILVVSVLLQFLAAALALRLVRTSVARFGWLAIFVAIALMAARRTITLYHTFGGNVTPDFAAESVALLISILMLVGVATIGPLFNAIARSEQALHTEKSRAQTYLDVVGVMIIALDLEGRITLANRKACEILGYSEEELIGKDWFTSYLPASVVGAARAHFEEVAQGSLDPTDYFETPVRTRSGETMLVVWQCTTLRDDEGTVCGTLCSGLDITERQEAQEKLRISEERYELAVAGTTDGLWDWDIETNAVDFSTRFKELLGYGVDEFENKFESLANALHPDERDRVFAAVESHHKHRSTYDQEFRLKTKSGEYRWFRARAKSVWDAGGRPIRMAGSIQDITEQKEAQSALRERDEQVRLLLHSTAEAIYGLDLDGNCTFCNPACLQILGYENADQLLGKNMHDLIHHTKPDGSPYPMHECRIYEAFRHGEGTHVDDEVLWRSDRTNFPAEYWSYPIQNDGKVVGSVVTFMDITERKKAARQLREASARTEAIFTNIADCIVLIDQQGTIERVNRATEELFGYSADEVVGRNVKLLMPEPYRREHDGELAAYLPTGIREIIGTRREVVGHRKDGSTFPLELHVSEIDLGDRQIYCGVVTNLTARKEAEDLVAAHNAELAHVARVNTMGEMAAGLAHEINQPLTAIVNYTSGVLRELREGGPVTSEILDALDKASSQARRAGEIIHRLHGFVGKRQPHQDPLSLAETIGNVIRLLATELRQAEVDIDQDVELDLPTVMGDSIQIQQVVLNLIKNGIEAMATTPAKDRRILVSATKIDANLTRISVCDRGHGLKVDDLHHIFDQFHTTKADGMGMGLSISRSIVELYGGRLTVESNQFGGATFSFTLPTNAGEKKYDN